MHDTVPEDHLVRKLEKAIDFSFIYDLVEDLYSDRGRPSIDPVVLIKLPFLQYTFGIRSMRRTIEEVHTNLAYRWFLGFGFYDKVPHFSTFGKNYERRFKDTDLFEQIFYR
ncbi:transposase, partial [Bhargavaea beijingensis]|uniref:transposase n=1 Tax=Bhargavaea beijingensis TaxID=426756 RepID=UPI00115F8BA4